MTHFGTPKPRILAQTPNFLTKTKPRQLIERGNDPFWTPFGPLLDSIFEVSETSGPSCTIQRAIDRERRYIQTYLDPIQTNPRS